MLQTQTHVKTSTVAPQILDSKITEPSKMHKCTKNVTQKKQTFIRNSQS